MPAVFVSAAQSSIKARREPERRPHHWRHPADWNEPKAGHTI